MSRCAMTRMLQSSEHAGRSCLRSATEAHAGESHGLRRLPVTRPGGTSRGGCLLQSSRGGVAGARGHGERGRGGCRGKVVRCVLAYFFLLNFFFCFLLSFCCLCSLLLAFLCFCLQPRMAVSWHWRLKRRLHSGHLGRLGSSSWHRLQASWLLLQSSVQAAWLLLQSTARDCCRALAGSSPCRLHTRHLGHSGTS